jgi:hypothetical protein
MDIDADSWRQKQANAATPATSLATLKKTRR